MEFKAERAQQSNEMQFRKDQEEEQRRSKERAIKQKQKKSTEAVKAYKEKMDHANMLNTEYRKLQEEDMQKVHERAKRLALRKK